MSPVIIDVQGDKFNLTSASAGVDFDLDSDSVMYASPGQPRVQMMPSWSSTGMVTAS